LHYADWEKVKPRGENRKRAPPHCKGRGTALPEDQKKTCETTMAIKRKQREGKGAANTNEERRRATLISHRQGRELRREQRWDCKKKSRHKGSREEGAIFDTLGRRDRALYILPDGPPQEKREAGRSLTTHTGNE